MFPLASEIAVVISSKTANPKVSKIKAKIFLSTTNIIKQ